MTTTSLPAAFADLERFVADWALTNEKERHRRMIDRGIDALRVFYDAMLPRYPAIVDYLNRFALDALPADAQTLYNLARTFVETAHPIDLNWRTTDIEDTFPIDRVQYLAPSGPDLPRL